MPMMPFMGVRISWLMLARNSLLARLADSATSFALQLDLAGSKLPGPFDNRLLDRRVGRLKSCLAGRDFAKFLRALNARTDENDILEDDPTRMLHPPPLGRQHPKRRLRPIDAAKKMVGRDDDRGRDQARQSR